MEDLELTGSRPPSVSSVRPPSSRAGNRSRSGYRVISEKSNVDELLFTSNHTRNDAGDNVPAFKPPWSTTPRNNTDVDKYLKKSRMRPLLWTPDVDRPTITSHSDRKGMRSSKGHKNSIDLNRYRPTKQRPSFCDETLFGPRLKEPSFDAPWAEKTKKKKPFLFSAVDYAKLTRDGSTLSAKYSSSGTLDGRPPSRQGRRPVTANTRPVTVEADHDIQATWKP